MARVAIMLPELGIPRSQIRVSLWLIRPGGRVLAGEPLVEVLAGPAVVDLAAPADGRLEAVFVEEDEAVPEGQPLGIIETGSA